MTKRNSYVAMLYLSFEEYFPCICSPAEGKHIGVCVLGWGAEVWLCTNDIHCTFHVIMPLSLGAIID